MAHTITTKTHMGSLELERGDLSRIISALRYDAKDYNACGMPDAAKERSELADKLDTIMPPLRLRG